MYWKTSTVWLMVTLSSACGGPGEKRAGSARGEQYENPFLGADLFVDPYSQAVSRAVAAKGIEAMLLKRIAKEPQADWLGDWTPHIKGVVRRYTTDAKSFRQLRVMVAYNVPNRDCGRYSMGGVEGPDAYRKWISELADGIGRRRAVVILEPDALPDLTTCLKPADQQARLGMIKFAVSTLKSKPRVAVYIDAGHPNWVAAEERARRLSKAGIHEANGFSLNVANYVATDKTIRYGKAISRLLCGNVPFVIDTSRNGRGEAPGGEWCNPEGRGLGHAPTVVTGDPLVHAFLWIKRPGESDGACNGGPAAGEWFQERALELSENARLK